MPRARILRFSGDAFRSFGVPDALLDQIDGLYSARRVLPTLADVAQYDAPEKLDIGAWYHRETVAASAMPHRYSAARLFVQVSLKHNFIQSAAVAFQKYSSSPNYSEKNLEWEQLFEYWPRAPSYELSGHYKHPEEVNKCQKVPAKADGPTDSDREDDSSSSDSSSDSHGVNEGHLDDTDFADLRWSLAKGNRGMLHLQGDDALACGRTLRMPETGCGSALAAATNRSWSPKCFRALQEAAKTWWSEHASEREMAMREDK